MTTLHKVEAQRVLQPNFRYGNAIFGHMGSSKGAAPKNLIINYEQFLSSVYSCFHELKNNLFFLSYCSVHTKKLVNINVKKK